VNVTTSLLGRIFNFGNVVVRTFTGEIIFRNMRGYDRMVSVIDEFRQRMQRQSEKVEKREIDKAIRVQLGLLDVETSQTSPLYRVLRRKNPDFPRKVILKISSRCGLRKTMSSLFRKYWPTLIGKVLGLHCYFSLSWWQGFFFVNDIRFGGIQQPWLSILFLLIFCFFVFAYFGGSTNMRDWAQ